jgi:hypothetical protein
MNTWVIIGLVVIVLHLILGFGWLAYKLSPKKKDKTVNDKTNTSVTK